MMITTMVVVVVVVVVVVIMAASVATKKTKEEEEEEMMKWDGERMREIASVCARSMCQSRKLLPATRPTFGPRPCDVFAVRLFVWRRLRCSELRAE